MAESDLSASDSDLSVVLSCYSSDFEEIEERIETIQPYQYEPEAAEPSPLSTAAADNAATEEDATLEDSRFSSVNNWCLCQACIIMPSVRECKCCQEIPDVRAMTEEEGVGCICQHPGFAAVCLNVWVLRTAYYHYRQQYTTEIEDENRRHRYTAYRQLARFIWQYLGRHIRVVLPACAVLTIRKAFPSADGTYTGFKDNYTEQE
ncbi:hypothetical protein BaRGS_00005846 [Batillaria attramentaria]|uniref:P2X purinoreceptor 7 intracellular domain-containing protein n=1 Tax=Batillaria attramentaria TaxID=370345 RepID=A0ABD0LUC1_9CAEN